MISLSDREGRQIHAETHAERRGYLTSKALDAVSLGMGTITLDDRDEAILARLRAGNADVGSLAAAVDCDGEYLRDRLPELADNGLVLRVHSDVYAITANGERTIDSAADGTTDDRIDTPPAVEDALESFDDRADRTDAVRSAFAFLRYWGEAIESEIVDAVYSEHPAGFDAPDEWWTECVRDRLAALPRVEPPESADRPWRYTGTPTVEKRTADGRDVSGPAPDAQTSVKYALERSELTADERAAVRAAFDFLAGEGEASVDEITAAVYPDRDAGYGSASEWWAECVREPFRSLPGVERSDADDDRWRYRASDAEPSSNGP